MGVVVPHGVLFRSSTEGIIRQKLIEENLLDAVIGLPVNLFFGTSIPAVILIFKRNKNNDTVLFIDASREYDQSASQNRLRREDIEKVIRTYENRINVEKYAYLASLAEIKENDFNLNILRYVDTFEPEPPIDVDALQIEIKEIDTQLAKVESELNNYLKELRHDS